MTAVEHEGREALGILAQGHLVETAGSGTILQPLTDLTYLANLNVSFNRLDEQIQKGVFPKYDTQNH